VIQKLGFDQKAGFPSYPGFAIVMRKPWAEEGSQQQQQQQQQTQQPQQQQ